MRALLLCLVLLSGCASHNRRDTYAHGDLDRDGCIAYRCEMICREDATEAQRKAFAAGTIDDGEREQLRRLAWWVAGDAGTTIAGLALCESLREMNPIVGADPHPLAVIAYSAAIYAYAWLDAARSPSWCSSARPIRTAANIRVAASISNAVTAAVCP